ncbi:hypothetical protein LguiB_002232 [Lonicera macranthoides]
MACIINCSYTSIKATATPIPQDPNLSPSSSSSPSPRQTKVILPKKKPEKWSTGVSPGDYGGPPVSTKLRKYWGGEKEDPITADEYIWNNEFMDRMKRLIEDPNNSSAPQFPPMKEERTGFLNFNRVASLDSLGVDMSKELSTPVKSVVEKQVEALPTSGIVARKWRPAPTRKEQQKWDRATKAATGGSDVMFREISKPKGDPAVLAAASREQYYKLKNRLQILTVGIGCIGLVSAYVSYTPEIAASYGAGFLGSLVYIRMLGSTVDSMADGAKGLMKGAIGQPRILVPVILVMIYNRWNGIVVPEYGLMHLELIPMLVGFFTYKLATFTQAIEEALNIVGNREKDSSTT